MSKIIEKIVSQGLPPKDTNVGWWNGEELKFYTNGEWKTTGGGSSNNKSLLDVLILINKPLSVFNIYPLYEEHPIEDFGISEDLLASIYLSEKIDDEVSIYIDNIYNKQTGEIYNGGGYLSKYDVNIYDLTIYIEDDEYAYDYRLFIDLTKKTGVFKRMK